MFGFSKIERRLQKIEDVHKFEFYARENSDVSRIIFERIERLEKAIDLLAEAGGLEIYVVGPKPATVIVKKKGK